MAQVQPLAQEFPSAVGVAKKKKKEKRGTCILLYVFYSGSVLFFKSLLSNFIFIVSFLLPFLFYFAIPFLALLVGDLVYFHL